MTERNLSKKVFNDILCNYAEEIALPAEKFPKQFFLCPVGLIGAGKSTVLEHLAKHISIIIVSTDDFRQKLKALGYGYESASDLTFAAVSHFSSKGYSVALDTNCGRPEKKQKIENLAREFRAQIIWIHVNPPEQYIKNKLQNFKHTWLFRDARHGLENYHNYKIAVGREQTKIPFLFTFDPSRSDLEKQIGEAVLVIKTHLLREKPS